MGRSKQVKNTLQDLFFIVTPSKITLLNIWLPNVNLDNKILLLGDYPRDFIVIILLTRTCYVLYYSAIKTPT